MTLEQVSYLGELIAALSVIGSLVYVARRVGQNTAMMSGAEWREAKWMIRNFGQRQANREAWRIVKEAFEKPFQAFIEDQITIGDKQRAENGA